MSGATAVLDMLTGTCELVKDPDILEGYRHDQAAPGLLEAGTPIAVARPRTTAEVQAVVRAAAGSGTPVVPRGAGSGLSGGANAIDGCIVLSLERMTDIVEIDEGSLLATVQPGVINDTLRGAASERGLWYAPDPASMTWSTIGGNVATNAGGLCCVKYGVTRDAVLGLEVVLADGRAVTLGRRTRKGVTGYDLAGLMVGSEGTLGVVTAATLRLTPMPARAATLAASFPTLGAAAGAIGRICRECVPSLLELMDAATLGAVEQFQPMDIDLGAAAYLFARADTGESQSVTDVERMAKRCEKAGATLVVTTDEEAEGRSVMAARRLAYPALERQGATLLDDVAVPIGAIAALLDGIERIAGRHEVIVGTFGHAGDGNMHPTIVYDRRDDDMVRRAHDAFDAIVSLALDLGGTVTGEHGIGLLKRTHARVELGPSLDLHRAVKRAFDPADILNPGKAI
jgi:glycolate dehydrogenase FAD-linked subunit